MKIAVYSRKSKATGRGESLENQVEMCRNYIVNHLEQEEKAEVFVYEEEGVSGATLERSQFQQMLADIWEKHFSYIVCYRLDRISRNVGDFSALLEKLESRGVAFVSVREQFDTGTPMGRAMMYIASVFAQLERETIAQRVRDNMLLLARSGQWLGGNTPIGFRSVRKEGMAGEKRISVLEEIPEEKEMVRHLFEQYLKKESLAGVERFCREKGWKGRGGKAFSRQAIKEILANPVYCTADLKAKEYFETELQCKITWTGQKKGLISYNKRDCRKKGSPRLEKQQWVIAEGVHNGFISGMDWVEVQKKMEKNQRGRNIPKQKNTYALLSGRIRCSYCGNWMIAKKRRTGTKFDYICSKKLREGTDGCHNRNLPGAETDRVFCEGFREYLWEDETCFLQEWKGLIKNVVKKEPLTSFWQANKRWEEKQRNLMRMLERNDIGEALIKQLNSKAQELQEEKQQLDRILLKKSENHSDNRIAIIKSWLDIKSFFDSLDIEEKREVISFFLKELVWDGRELQTVLYRKP